jgi:isoleucyl-tRNA synthetase
MALMPHGSPIDDPGLADLVSAWTVLVDYRERVLKALEPFRAEKHKSLDALVTIAPRAADRAVLERRIADLPDLFVVSQVRITDPVADGAEPAVKVEQAPGSRCERCWKYTMEPQGDLCERCARVLAARGKGQG